MATVKRFEAVAIRGRLVAHHLLIDRERKRVVVVDGGFPRTAVNTLGGVLGSRGFTFDNVEAILLTHGHLDHTLNLARLKRETGAPLFAPGEDRRHIEGRFPYRGMARIAGWLEAVGRIVLDYEVPEVDHWFAPGDRLPFWGGLEVIGLPGHTPGHCGFYSESRKLLLAGDLFSLYGGRPKPPPSCFNVDGDRARESLGRAQALVPPDGGILLNHGGEVSPEAGRRALVRLANEIGRGEVNPPP